MFAKAIFREVQNAIGLGKLQVGVRLADFRQKTFIIYINCYCRAGQKDARARKIWKRQGWISKLTNSEWKTENYSLSVALTNFSIRSIEGQKMKVFNDLNSTMWETKRIEIVWFSKIRCLNSSKAVVVHTDNEDLRQYITGFMPQTMLDRLSRIAGTNEYKLIPTVKAL